MWSGRKRMSDETKKALEILSRKRKLIMMHNSADPDALGSAYAISKVFGGDIDLSGGLNRPAKRLLLMLKAEGKLMPDYTSYDTIISVDAASPGQLPANLHIDLVIDHHMKDDSWNADVLLIDEDAFACTQVVLDLIREAEKLDEMDGDTAFAMLAGMYSDTKRLRIGDVRLFEDFTDMLDISGADMEDLAALLEDRDMSMKISIMKGMQRLKFDTFKGFMLCSTHVSSFESMVANALIDSGADIAFVAAPRDDKIRVSGRASDRVLREGLHLGKLFKELGAEIEGEGGGHDGAAGFSTKGDIEAVLKMCMTKTMDTLRSQKP